MSLKLFLADILKCLESQSELNNLFDFRESLSRWQQRLNDDFFRIAVVGEFSSGKSTFINALIGKDILSHATIETTATLSRLVNVSSNDERNGHGRAYMKDGSIIDILDLNELKYFTTTQSQKYKVAEEVEYVEIYIPILQTNQSIVVVDTPGLNGMAEGLLEQTIKIVHEAHACIYILQRRGLTNNDVRFLNEFLLPYQQNFIFVQNFMDEFNAEEGETVESRINDANNILHDQVFKDKDKNQYFFEICCVSALEELAGRDDSIQKLYSTSKNDLTSEDRKHLLETSGFEEFRQILNRNFNQSELEKIKFAGMLEPMIKWCEKLLNRINYRKRELDNLYLRSAEYKADKNWDSLKEKISRSKSGDEEALRGFISRQCNELKKWVQSELVEKINSIAIEVKQPLSNFTDVEQLERYSLYLNHEIQSKIFSVQSQLNEYCNLKLKEIYQLIKERIEEYSGIHQTNLSAFDFNFKMPSKTQDFVSTDNIKVYEHRINDSIVERDSQQNELSRKQNYISSEQSNLNSLNYRLQSANSEHYRLGSRPQKKVWEEEEEYYRDRTGLFGGISTWVRGQKKDTRKVTKTDDSAGQEWDRKKQELENRIDSLRRQKSAIERRLNQLRSEAEENQQRIRYAEEQISRLNRDLKLERESIEHAKKLAKENHFRMCRNKMLNELDKYFGNEHEGIVQNLLEQWSRLIETSKADLQSRALQHFEESFRQKLRDIESSKSSTDTKLKQQMANIEQTKNVLANIISDLKLKASEM